MADLTSNASGSAGPARIELSADSISERLDRALQSGDLGTADQMARAMACHRPDDPKLARVSRELPAVVYLNTRAAVSRMAQCLAPSDGERIRERIHRSVKANRPNLMPPHWMREVMFEAERLQALIQGPGLKAALNYLRDTDLAGHRHYMPRFRALRHLVLFNAIPGYRESFLDNSLAILNSLGTASIAENDALHGRILDSLISAANWREDSDTIVILDGALTAQRGIRKRIRAGIIGDENLSNNIIKLKDIIFSKFSDYWFKHRDADLIHEFFGFDQNRSVDVTSVMTLHVNEILEGPVLGPHYHSGYRYEEAQFPLLSGVYYPTTVPQNDETRAGYLELGRPDFDLPFEPICITHRPVAGDLVLFPAFAYHGVVPIDQAPRYSVNIDVYLKPKSATTWSVSEFFNEAP